MRRFAFTLLAGAFLPSLAGAAAAQGFGVYEQGTCTMGRAGVAAARPCADGSAIFFNPAGLAGLSGNRASLGVTLIAASGSFTDDFLGDETPLDNPLIPVPNLYITHAFSPKLTAGIGVFAPYGLETKWPTENFEGRFVGYNTDLASIYIQPTIGYQLHDRLKVGVGLAYITSHLRLHQRSDLSQQIVPPTLAALFPTPLPAGTRFAALGVPTGTDFADAELTVSGSGFAVNFGAILRVNDRLTIGGHWLTRKTITYDGDAVFNPVATGLEVPVTIGTCPVCVPAGTPIDGLVAAGFDPGGPLADGAVSTSIIMPPQGSLGFAYDMTDTWTVMADYHLVVWGWFNKIEIDFDRFPNDTLADIELHPSNEDTHGFRIGTEYRTSPKLMLRGGYLYHSAASPSEFVTPLLPEGARNEFTIGAGFEATPSLHVDLGYQYIKQNDRRGTVNTALGNTGLYRFSAHLLGVGLSYTF
ncbi:MAG: outer membrane protein transport protein [Gemmatimonadales bacterium]|nr:outer membrane protein transport protein [Gemmatimonadales bacterium]